MPGRKNRTQSAHSFAAEAERQLHELTAALHAARASLAGINRSLHVARPRGGKRTIRGSTTTPSLFLTVAASSFGSLLSGDAFIDGLGGNSSTSGNNSRTSSGSFQQSATQFAAKLFNASLRGQRIS